MDGPNEQDDPRMDAGDPYRYYCVARVYGHTGQLISTGWRCQRRAVANGYCTQHHKARLGQAPQKTTELDGGSTMTATSDPICNQCGHGKSVHDHATVRQGGGNRGTWACCLAHCGCAYRGPFQGKG